MIYIFTALYCEAKPVIQYFDLKRLPDINGFRFFSDGAVNLLITGTGALNAAIGVTALCSVHSPNPGDILVNIGICGTGNPDLKTGSLILCNKIVDLGAYKAYYPDMLFKHSFIEGTVLTSPVPVTGRTEGYNGDSGVTVTDMEASGVFHAGAVFFKTHQMFFFKIVSDHQSGEELSSGKVSELTEANTAPVFGWITPIHGELQGIQNVFSDDEKLLLKQLSEMLKLTVTMQHQLNQVMRYHKTRYGGFADKLREFIADELKQPCKTKNEGKKYFEELRKRFI